MIHFLFFLTLWISFMSSFFNFAINSYSDITLAE
jgi:hypothetical protein